MANEPSAHEDTHTHKHQSVATVRQSGEINGGASWNVLSRDRTSSNNGLQQQPPPLLLRLLPPLSQSNYIVAIIIRETSVDAAVFTGASNRRRMNEQAGV